jgi:hypothetical protein
MNARVKRKKSEEEKRVRETEMGGRGRTAATWVAGDAECTRRLRCSRESKTNAMDVRRVKRWSEVGSAREEEVV